MNMTLGAYKLDLSDFFAWQQGNNGCAWGKIPHCLSVFVLAAPFSVPVS
jgi:hypothetical protein